MFGTILSGALLGLASQTAAAAVPISAAYQGPARMNLSGHWDFRFDPNGKGKKGKWFSPDAPGSWEKIVVPGSYNEEFSRRSASPNPNDLYRFYEGKAWYRTQFTGPKNTQADIFLHFSGTVLRQKVWLNGEPVGASVLPWLDVSYDVSRQVRRGQENTLVVEVDDSILPRAIPDSKWRGWWDDGGLIWPVYLEERQPTRSNSYVVTTMLPKGGWRLQVQTGVHEDAPANARLSLSLADSAGKIVWQKIETAPSSSNLVSLTAAADLSGIQSWSPRHPVLYRLTVKTEMKGQPPDITSYQIGFRQIEARGSRLYLNGKPLTLRGIDRHEFAPGVGQSVSVAQNLKDLENIKSLGANFVRLAHYSQSQDVYADCDKLGLLVWTEMPAWQSSAETLASPQVWRDYAKPELTAMVHQFRNHPSVIIWSVANEIPSNTPQGAAYIAKAIALVHHLDPTRMATFASDRRERDISMGPEDIVSVNEYYGWYYGKLDDVGPMLDRMHKKYPNKPILVSEFGSEAVAGWNPAMQKPGGKNFSYAFQVRLLRSHLSQIYEPQRRSYVAGGTIWVYSDFPDPHRIGGGHPYSARYRNTKGLLTAGRKPKPAYWMVKNFYHRLMGQSETGTGKQVAAN